MTERVKVNSAATLAWPVDARSRVERLLLRVYQLIERDHPRVSDAHRHALFLLVGVAFSLWRAAFLSDQDRSEDAMLQDARAFLNKLVSDNAIGYPQDRDTRGWSGGYYVNNALFRLTRIREIARDHMPDVVFPPEYWDRFDHWRRDSGISQLISISRSSGKRRTGAQSTLNNSWLQRSKRESAT